MEGAAASAGDLPAASAEIVNALTIDVEDYFQDFAVSARFPRASWDELPSRVEANVERVLMVLDNCEVRATFFTTGWIAERHPHLIGRIVESGHELASLGYDHVRATEQGWGQYLADVRLAKAVLEDASGSAVAGYRAPGLSIGEANAWAFECLVEAGYRYSSSGYPVCRLRNCARGAPRFAHEARPGLLEIPLATVRVLRVNWPAGGAAALRLLPYAFSRWSIRRINELEHRPAMLHFHPWELDPEQPRRYAPGPCARVRHYGNRRRMELRLHRLLREFKWDRADRAYLAQER